MKMKKRCIVPSTLLLLSLPSTVTVADDMGADILLPSQGKVVTVAAAKKKGGEEEERPWKCCDIDLCYRALPRACRCLDEVEQCAPTCKSCEPAPSDPSRRVCNDRYTGDMGPTCTEALAAGGN
ncbi:Bowman-Birk type trypsin inhibitor-like [Triticum aestivum]|uniref:Bowman-Birk type trypsin inhibitor-like n=1 Tax=Triticum aestivum TaxID=4565 RepID=UPI001D02D9C4|nr:Bowman-Birk type trypsin inhibitor-like [Triticum aestivum]